MIEFTLISHHLCPYVQRAVIVLAEKNVAYRRIDIDLSAKPAWFTDLSPLGRTPVLQVGDAVVFESQVIAEYVDEITHGSLHPSDPLEKARHRAWIEFGSETLSAIARFYNASDHSAFSDATANLRAKFERIEREIDGPFFSGEQFHMIDGVWGTIFRYFDVFDDISDFGVLSGLSATERWRQRIRDRASVAGAVSADYPERLRAFLRARPSYLSALA